MKRMHVQAIAKPLLRRKWIAAAVLAASACLSMPAFAQFDAGQQANLMHQHELMRKQTTGDGNRREARAEDRAGQRGKGITPRQQAAIEAEMRGRFEQHRRELLPEYERRVKSDGKPAADAWLRRVATEAGRRDGNAIRAKYGQ